MTLWKFQIYFILLYLFLILILSNIISQIYKFFFVNQLAPINDIIYDIMVLDEGGAIIMAIKVIYNI